MNEALSLDNILCRQSLSGLDGVYWAENGMSMFHPRFAQLV